MELWFHRSHLAGGTSGDLRGARPVVSEPSAPALSDVSVDKHPVAVFVHQQRMAQELPVPGVRAYRRHPMPAALQKERSRQLE